MKFSRPSVEQARNEPQRIQNSTRSGFVLDVAQQDLEDQLTLNTHIY